MKPIPLRTVVAAFDSSAQPGAGPIAIRYVTAAGKTRTWLVEKRARPSQPRRKGRGDEKKRRSPAMRDNALLPAIAWEEGKPRKIDLFMFGIIAANLRGQIDALQKIKRG